MSEFSNRLTATVVHAESPDGSIILTATGTGDLEVSVAHDVVRRHTDGSFAEQLELAIGTLLAAAHRSYLEARRDSRLAA
jgi:hypothetical protein